MKEKIVIFGASGGGVKVAQTLESFGIDFYCFLDNDKKKWGTTAKGTAKKICCPDILLKECYRIIIASEHQAEIEGQLEQMGQLANLFLKEDLLIPCVEGMLPRLEQEVYGKLGFNRTEKRRVILDLTEGVQLGGIETWTYTVAKELQKLGVTTEVFAKRTDMQPPKEIAACFSYFDIEYCDFKENVVELAKQIIKRSPCAVIVSKHTQILYAAYLAKKLCTEGEVQIISVIHNDLITLYRRQRRLQHITDKTLCVSMRIKENLVDRFGLEKTKVFYKESPVYFEEELNREYTLDARRPIRIGYAGRLEKTQKRTDLLLLCIQRLEEIGCNYSFTIAGAGSYKEIIEKYVSDNGLGEKIFLAGQVPKEQMADFWKGLDIYVSVSDFEGSSISLLEAMSNGVVPIVTEVSGTDEFVQQGKSGYVVRRGDIDRIALYVKNIDENRFLLQSMGEHSAKMIAEKCSPEKYGKYIVKMCGMEAQGEVIRRKN